MGEKVFGQSHIALGAFTRPNNTTAYAAGQVVNDSTSAGTVMKIPSASREVGGLPAGSHTGAGIIQGAILVDGANQATKLDSELWIFDVSPAAQNDAAAFNPSDLELAALVGIIAFPLSNWKVGGATAGVNGNAVNEVDNLGIAFNTVNGNTLFAVLVARNAYTPIAAGTFNFRIKVLD